jgi:hypothetical protein
MKQANNTEMDRLLQRHARRWDAAVSNTGESNGGDDAAAINEAGAHLDADEMSSYAEGALPPAARARYASHLADCRSCRATVTNLTLAAHDAAEERERAAPESASPSKPWWSALAALFAPPVLRYAVPAIMLLGVIVVALVATRDRSEPQFVAQNQEKQADNNVASERAAPEPSAAQIPPGESAGTANTSTTPTETTKADATANPTPSDGILRSNANAGQISSAPTSETHPPPAQVSAADDSPARRERAPNDELYATEPKPAPPPPVEGQPAAPSAGKVEEERQDREPDAAATGTTTETANLGRASSDSKEAEAKDRSPAAGEDTGGQSGATQTRARAMASKAAKSPAAKRSDEDRSNNSTETRSVAGRRFRRQGDAWIDTAYNSSRSTINVARGSDQYRALAADEPGLRSIAEQLGGEVIVVWKGKAYRIH